MIYNNILELIGNTPLVRLGRFFRGEPVTLLAKLECRNPAGSAKDRAALFMIEDAERKGLLRPGATIIEPTSGNTGIGLAAVGTYKGYRVVLTMPDNMSMERRMLLSAYGASLVLTDGALGMSGAIARAEALAKEIPGSLLMGQFTNPANPEAHYRTTGPEIWAQTGGRVSFFVVPVGTGGVITGAGRYLKEKNPALRVIAAEPSGSSVLLGNPPGQHGLQGMGAGFIPDILDQGVYDEVIAVKDEDAFCCARALVRTEGLLAGISSGAALYAAMEIGRREENRGKTIVAILPDSGERYLSSGVFKGEDGEN